MSALASAPPVGRLVPQTIAFLLVAAGAVQLWVTAQGSAGWLGCLPGFLGVAAGAGLWARARWARWLTIGACYAAIVSACVLPVLAVLLRPHHGTDAAFGANLWLSALAFMLGAIGYFGLGYLRSAAGRREFFGQPVGEEPLSDEPSSAVIWSSLVWVAALGISAIDRAGDSSIPTATRPPQPHIDSSRELPESAPRPAPQSPEQAATSGPPNLVGIGMCLEPLDQLRVHFTNLGGAGQGLFQISQGSTRQDLSLVDAVQMPVPNYREIRSFDLGRLSGLLVAPARGIHLFADIDAADVILETTEADNLVYRYITRRPDGSVNLPACGDIDDRFHDTPEPDERLPDLIPLGLCRTSDGLAPIAVVVGNIGTAKGNAQVMIDAHLGRGLREISAVLPFTPWPKAVGKAALPLAWATTRDLAAAGFQLSVELDPRQLIAELDETNNSAIFEITRGTEGKDALPDCTLIDVRVEKWGTTKKVSKRPE